jgi:hypothetical protein
MKIPMWMMLIMDMFVGMSCGKMPMDMSVSTSGLTLMGVPVVSIMNVLMRMFDSIMDMSVLVPSFNHSIVPIYAVFSTVRRVSSSLTPTLSSAAEIHDKSHDAEDVADSTHYFCKGYSSLLSLCQLSHDGF